MKFGAHLQSLQYSEWRFYYLDYDALKKQVKQMAAAGASCPEPLEKEFIDILDKELQKVVSFQAIKSGELNSRAQHCETIIDNIVKNPTATPQVTRISRVEEELTRITAETNELAKYARLNYTGFLKILKKHDKHTSYHLRALFIQKLNANPFYRENFDPLILKLSKLYDTVRNGGEASRKAVASDGGAQSFVRRTTKYWVHPDNVTEVKLRVLKNLPVLVFGSAKDYDPAITSIYYDNENFDLYRGRLEKSEGAQAIRFRWYGSVKNQEIFMERKTHREDWTGEKSIKERFPLKEKYVNTFCDGTFTLEKQIEKLRERAQKSEKELASMATLSQEMQSAIVEKKLVPTMRTFYNRTAFQLPGDARVRISLDTELTMVREDNYDGVMRAGTNWRRMDIGTDWPFTQLEESDVCRFPYAVLEVKLQTNVGAEPPAWVTDLINSHLVEEVPKFSKFIHGCATLLENRVTLLPFWLPQMAKDIRKPAPERYHLSHDHAQSQDLMIEETRVRKGKGKARASGSSSAAPSFMDDVPPTPRNGSGSRAPNGVDHHVVHLGDVDDASEEFDAAEESSALLGGDDGGPQPTGKKPKGILGQIQGLVNKLHVRDAREQRQRRQQRGGGAYGGTSVAGSAEGDARSAVTGLHGADINSRIPAEMHGKRIIIPVRVEPKVFFANERTFLAWMHFSSVIAGLALGLLNFGDKVGQIAGIVFTLNAMLIMAYGLYLFQWRAEKIRNRETGPYDDRGGPTFVVLTLFAAMVINFYLKLSTI